MTAIEAFRTSAEADVYFTAEGKEWYLINGCRTGSAVLITAESANGERRRFDLAPAEELSVRIER
jgi:hypothetical protein